jgi:diketogulonate reductase-like aldo/keto reductase
MTTTMSALFEKLPLTSHHLQSAQHLPAFIYGTAWKKAATADLVYHALCNGFTAIDTAAQPKHYQEDLVAAGISRAIKAGKIRRRDIYLQTKFTSITGQDPQNMPYDPKGSITEQVNSSLMSSLRNFNFADVTKADDDSNPYIDTLVLHSPMSTMDDTMEVWRTLEQYVPGEIRHLGISNCTLFDLMNIYERSTVKPSVVQNRFYANTRYDIGLRKFCADKGLIYQSFWSLSANPRLVASAPTRQLAKQLNISPESALYCLILGLGNMVALNGTTNPKHMQEDWKAIALAKDYAEASSSTWGSLMEGFKMLIGQPA